MTVRRPAIEEVAELSHRLALGLTPEEIEEFHGLVDQVLRAYDWLDADEDEVDPGEASPRIVRRTGQGYRPPGDENPLGAWFCKTSIATGVSGPLTGRTIVIKDNICVAGVPMMNGSALFEGYIPDRDATVVERVLAAGATVVGKATCESFCASGGSHTSDTGPVLNPYDLSRSTGGSSSGCAALLANREVDLAIGGDQGGSIRCPSSWSGVCGLKPTYGLVPYTGTIPMEPSLDHLGPMARTTEDVALLLDVIAGPDGLDPQQRLSVSGFPQDGYTRALSDGIKGLRIGVVEEGFGWETSEPEIDRIVLSSVNQLRTLGAEVAAVSIPWHRHGGKITHAIAAEGSTALLFKENCRPIWTGSNAAPLVGLLSRVCRSQPEKLPVMVKLQALSGLWMNETYSGHYYSKAQWLARCITWKYDEVLADFDLLALPTTLLKATVIPPSPLSVSESVRLSYEMGGNTSPFNLTGHPAMSLPCGLSEGLPVGLMLVGRRGHDAIVLQAAHAFEQNIFRAPAPEPGRTGL